MLKHVTRQSIVKSLGWLTQYSILTLIVAIVLKFKKENIK